MRRRASALVLSVAVPAALALPIVRPPRPAPHPVPPTVHTMRLAGVNQAARTHLRQSDHKRSRTVASGRDLAVLTAAKSVDGFAMLGVTWEPTGNAPALQVEVRTRGKRGGWSAWAPLEVAPAEGPDPASAEAKGLDIRAGTAPSYVGAADGVQVAVHAPDGALPRDLRLDLVDPGTSAADAAVTSPDTRGAANAAVKLPDLITRAEWGADPSLRNCFAGYSDTILAGIVHHTATSNDYTRAESPAIVRSIYAYHTQSRGWCDIGYNFLVDKYGQIFEGRWGGIDKPVIGAHALHYDTETFGVSVIGNYMKVKPTEAALTSVEKVAAYKLGAYHRDPEGTVDYEGTTIDVLSGHRDVEATACPGTYLYARLPDIRAATSQMIGADPSPARQPAGDFDADGYNDLVMRAPGEAIGSRAHAGLLTVVPGSASGPVPSRAQGWNQATPGVAGAPEAGDRFGSSTASGDFNADGYDDLAIGVPFEVLGPKAGVDTGHGAVHLLFGSPGGLTAANSQWLTIADAGVAKDDGDEFGAALAAGDVNADSVDDLVVGVPGGGSDDAGSVVLYLGSAGALDTSPMVRSANGQVPLAASAGGSGDRFGAALAIGDTNMDGHDDLVVGAPGADPSGVTDAGAVAVLPGGGSGLDTAQTRVLTQATPGVPGAIERGDRFGASVAAGQFDGLSGVDIAVGAPGEGIAGRGQAGMINVLYAGDGGVSGVGAEGRSQNFPGVAGGSEPGDRFGARLAAADLDGDGLGDLAVSVVGEDLRGRANAGAVAVFSGTAGGLGGDEFWSQGKPGVPGVNERGDEFGSSLIAGAFDTGATVDLTIGVAGENGDRGGVRVLYGGSSLLTSSGARNVDQDTPGVPGRAERGDRAGS